MTFSEIVSVTGLPGLYKVIGNRKDGLIVSSIAEGGSRFVAARQHMFSTLDNITIYTTDEEPASLKEVFKSMHAHGKCPDPKSPDAELKAYLSAVLPTYDTEKVYTSDIKKLIKWYLLLQSKNLMDELLAEAAKEHADTVTEAEVVAEEVAEKPAKKTAKKKAAAETAPEAEATEEKPKAKKTKKAADKA